MPLVCIHLFSNINFLYIVYIATHKCHLGFRWRFHLQNPSKKFNNFETYPKHTLQNKLPHFEILKITYSLNICITPIKSQYAKSVRTNVPMPMSKPMEMYYLYLNIKFNILDLNCKKVNRDVVVISSFIKLRKIAYLLNILILAMMVQNWVIESLVTCFGRLTIESLTWVFIHIWINLKSIFTL